MIFAGETEVLGEKLPSATLSTTNPTWIDPGSNPGLRGERPATNRLSHGTASHVLIFNENNKEKLILTLFIEVCVYSKRTSRLMKNVKWKNALHWSKT
jgi:hypothetical protein